MRIYGNPPSEFSAKVYGEETKITKAYSDMDINELLEVFRRLALGCQFSEETWRDGVMQMANLYEEEMREKFFENDIDSIL
jgi:hypothetical protein